MTQQYNFVRDVIYAMLRGSTLKHYIDDFLANNQANPIYTLWFIKINSPQIIFAKNNYNMIQSAHYDINRHIKTSDKRKRNT